MTDRYESRATTHAAVCWSWGPAHYECAVREIERPRSENEKLRTALKRLIEVNETEAGDDFKAWASAMLDAHAAIGDGAVDEK